jgi:chemotaxis protein histidine kinase CheA
MARDPSEIPSEAAELLGTIRQHAEATSTVATKATESQVQVAAALADAQAKSTEIASIATEAAAARTKISDTQAILATKSQHIEDAQTHADKVRADLDKKLTEATQQATEAEGFKSRAQSAADASATVLTETRTAKGAAESEAAAAAEARKKAEESAEVSKKLADKSEAVDTKIADYEKRLDELEKQSQDRLKTIEDLLPGATGAGLAHSLDKRRQTFLKPHTRWQALFIGALTLIAAVAVSGLLHVYSMKSIPTYDELARLLLARLPLAGALLWVALHASREAALAKRLEEDYGYKSVIASSFEGFRRQMADINVDLKANSPLTKLCGDTLSTLAELPGRIYDKHKLTVSPIDEVKECARIVVEAAQPIIDAAKKLKVPGT